MINVDELCQILLAVMALKLNGKGRYVKLLGGNLFQLPHCHIRVGVHLDKAGECFYLADHVLEDNFLQEVSSLVGHVWSQRAHAVLL